MGKKIASTYKPHGGHDYGYRCMKHLREALETLSALRVAGV
ncbi:MAG: hypothetical protein V4482_04010 [Pseudomonadota bacterium]